MVEMHAEYKGQLSCVVKHGPSGAEITTDAPKDNHGLGRSFSPTDLLAAALGTCTMTVMGIYAQKHNLDLTGARADIVKEAVADPVRRVGSLTVKITLPAAIPVEQREVLERVARTCPVSNSLHPNTLQNVSFEYK
jgi:putative redox protein